jgi:phage terminase small subunit
MNRKKPDWGTLSPAMRALPNDRWRKFVWAYLSAEPGYGAATSAARAAGYKAKTAHGLNTLAYVLMHDPRMISAIAEQSKLVVRAGSPEAVNALFGMIRNPEHKDHARAVAMVLDRTNPVVSHQYTQVTHQVIDHDAEALAELRALRQLGTPRMKLLEIYGGNGLDRLEQQEAADNARRATAAKVIDGEYSEVKDV